VRPERDGVVVADDPLVLEAEDGVRIKSGRPRPIGGGRGQWPLGKARIEAREEVGETDIRAVAIPDPGEAEFAAQAILEGAKEPLDAALRLGAMRGDPVDAQFLHGAFDLGGGGFPSELLGQRQRARGHPVKDAMAIAIRGDGDALGLGEGVKDLEVAVRVFLVPKGGGRDFPRGVINNRQEGEARTALLQPIVVAAIELHEEAFLRHALPAAAVAGWTPAARAASPGSTEETADRRARDRDPLAFGQELGEVLVIHIGVGGGREHHDPTAERSIDPIGGRPPAIAMDEGDGPSGPIGPPQPTDLAHRPPEKLGGLNHQEIATIQRMQDRQTLLGTLRQGNQASPVPAQWGEDIFADQLGGT
jgi:hypothetical protein